MQNIVSEGWNCNDRLQKIMKIGTKNVYYIRKHLLKNYIRAKH